MNNIFLSTRNGYVNLSHVHEARSLGNDQLGLHVGENNFSLRHDPIPSTVVSIVPAEPGWETVTLFFDEDSTYSPLKTPIIAWGLTATSEVVPITPMEPGGLHGSDYGVMQQGDPRVWSPSEQGFYPNEADWLAEMRVRQDERVAPQVQAG